jgi:hypothetical protein
MRNCLFSSIVFKTFPVVAVLDAVDALSELESVVVAPHAAKAKPAVPTNKIFDNSFLIIFTPVFVFLFETLLVIRPEKLPHAVIACDAGPQIDTFLLFVVLRHEEILSPVHVRSKQL